MHIDTKPIIAEPMHNKVPTPNAYQSSLFFAYTRGVRYPFKLGPICDIHIIIPHAKLISASNQSVIKTS